MEKLLGDLKKYFHETLNISINIRTWNGQKDLPFFLIDSYNFCEISLFEHPTLLILAKDDTDTTPAIIQKHWKQIQKKWDGFAIYIESALSSYNRKRLMEHHIPFIIPGNQMYLPHLGIDLREHFRGLHNRKPKSFSPATQAVVIYALIRKTNEKLTPTILAEKLGYTLMTITRAFAELKSAGIGEICRKGRELIWFFSNKKTLWEQAKSYLRDPVKKRIWLKYNKPKIIAGLSALSKFSMLVPPILPVFAISITEWHQWKHLGVIELPSPEGANFELEIWHYDPQLFAKKCIADPFSLYFSLEANKNERIESALEELMEKIKW